MWVTACSTVATVVPVGSCIGCILHPLAKTMFFSCSNGKNADGSGILTKDFL